MTRDETKAALARLDATVDKLPDGVNISHLSAVNRIGPKIMVCGNIQDIARAYGKTITQGRINRERGYMRLSIDLDGVEIVDMPDIPEAERILREQEEGGQAQ